LFKWSKQLKDSIHRRWGSLYDSLYVDFKCGCKIVEKKNGVYPPHWYRACKDHLHESQITENNWDYKPEVE
jgi:hypothetical protein